MKNPEKNPITKDDTAPNIKAKFAPMNRKGISNINPIAINFGNLISSA